MTRTAHGRHARHRQEPVFDGDFTDGQNITVILAATPDDGAGVGRDHLGRRLRHRAPPLATTPAVEPEPGHVLGPLPAGITMPAAIGDDLRSPATWCEMHPCITWHRHPESAGYADDRHRAIAAGWRVDGLGRLACPPCQQTHPGYWTARPLARTGAEVAW